MGWQLVRNSQDWDAYRAKFAVANNMERNAVVWGAGPTSFPCLVDGFAPSPIKVITAYVYPDDAAVLMHAAQPQAQAMQAMPIRKQDADHAPDDWRAFSASTAAHVLSIVEFLTETGICSKEKYEETYNTMLAQVDQWTTEDRNERLARVTQRPES